MKTGAGRGVGGLSGNHHPQGPGPAEAQDLDGSSQMDTPGHASSRGIFNSALLERGLSHSAGSWKRQNGERAPEQAPKMTGAEGQHSWTT